MRYAALILGFLFAVPVSAQPFETLQENYDLQKVTTSSGIAVYSQPSTEAEVVDAYPAGTDVHIVWGIQRAPDSLFRVVATEDAGYAGFASTDALRRPPDVLANRGDFVINDFLADVVIIWLICGAVAGGVASRKGQSVGLWFLFGALFGPLGVLSVFAIPEDKQQKES